jgi:hypothetical protein
MSNPNLSPDQFPKITSSRHAYGTASVYTEPHRATNSSGKEFDIEEYHWHDGDDSSRYIEARGPMIKKDGSPGRYVRDIRQPPANVMDEMKRLNGRS